jgi:DNA-binding NarL/FixJ family response regulator
MELARLLILAEERLLGLGVASLLAPRFETHAIESFERACRLLGSGHQEVAVWLGECADEETIEQLEELQRSHPAVRLCLLARTADPAALRSLLIHTRGGVAVLLRTDRLDVGEIVAGLEGVLAGNSTLQPRVLESLLEASAAPEDALSPLTPGERDILELVALGLRNKEIAKRLWKSEKAVEKQVSHVFTKLGLDQRRSPHLDRRVTAARIFFACRPNRVGAGVPDQTAASAPA